MSVYHKFDDSDIIHYNLTTSPRSTFASGTSGWRGSTGLSGSISMYGGIRSRETTGTDLTIQPIYHLDTHSIDGKIQLSASYPFTGSLSYVRIVDRDIDKTDSVWGEKYFQPIMNLYDYYSRTNADYATSSYDYYMLYSEAGSSNKVIYSASFSTYNTMSSSFTLEAMIKPFLNLDNHTVISRTDLWSLYVTGSRLAFSASDGSGLVRTSSIDLTSDRWQHVVYRSGDSTGSFHIDLLDAGEHVSTGSIDSPTDGNANNKVVNVAFDQTNTADSFHGFIFDVKVWNTRRTVNQISSSFDRTLTDTTDENLLIYSRFNDGTESTSHGFDSGSGSFNYANELSVSISTSGTLDGTHFIGGSNMFMNEDRSDWPTSGRFVISEGLAVEEIMSYHLITVAGKLLNLSDPFQNFNQHEDGASVRLITSNHGEFIDFDTRQAPIWHPNDNTNFITSKTSVRNTIDEIQVIHIPSMFYGKQIATGSIRLVCNSHLSSSLQRVLVDDGRGGLYLSGSATSSSLESREEYTGVSWNKVGNVFYTEGLVVIKDPSLLDFASHNSASPFQNDLLEVSFAGLHSIPTKVFMCRINGAEANCSHNSSYSARNNDTGKLEINQDKPVTWITSVGVYDKNRKLVAIAKLASPIRNREKDKMNIRLKLDF